MKGGLLAGVGVVKTSEHRSLCNPQMLVKAVSRKEETIYFQDPEMWLPSLGPSSFKMD